MSGYGAFQVLHNSLKNLYNSHFCAIEGKQKAAYARLTRCAGKSAYMRLPIQ